MRDPNRIEETCNMIAEIWRKYPDFRFMQMICNFQRYIGNDGYYLEEDKFIDLLEDYMREVVGK